jgi:hypothetical protein
LSAKTLPAVPEALLAVCMFLGAALYTSVGHAGASAYLALMVLFGLPPTTMRPTALVLNILVASFASARYLRAGLFRWRVLWPVLLGALSSAGRSSCPAQSIGRWSGRCCWWPPRGCCGRWSPWAAASCAATRQWHGVCSPVPGSGCCPGSPHRTGRKAR